MLANYFNDRFTLNDRYIPTNFLLIVNYRNQCSFCIAWSLHVTCLVHHRTCHVVPSDENPYNVHSNNLTTSFDEGAWICRLAKPGCGFNSKGGYKERRTIEQSNAIIITVYIIQWNLAITTTSWDISLPSGAHLGGQRPPRWAPEGRNC